MYTGAFLDHFQNPRGQGSLDGATHVGAAVDPACGDELALDLCVEEETITQARFRVRGCAGAIAVGSALVTLLPGRPARVDAVSREELAQVLGAVPATKQHALRLALNTLQDALKAGPSGE